VCVCVCCGLTVCVRHSHKISFHVAVQVQTFNTLNDE